MIVRFGMADLHPMDIPADPNKRLKANTEKCEGEKYMQFPYPYKQAVGALLYVALSTRPDISFAVGQIAQQSHSPDDTHWLAVLHIFAYLLKTKHLGLWLGGKMNGLLGFSDSDFAGNLDDRSSTSGSIFFYHGGPVAWSSRKQKCIALSTTEAEYVAGAEASATAIWLRCLCGDLNGVDQTVPMFCDNNGAVLLAHNPEFHPKTKHIQNKYHFIRRAVEEKKITVTHIRAEDQLADIFTKPLPKVTFESMRARIGVGSLKG